MNLHHLLCSSNLEHHYSFWGSYKLDLRVEVAGIWLEFAIETAALILVYITRHAFIMFLWYFTLFNIDVQSDL